MSVLNILLVCDSASSHFGGEAILPLNYFTYLSKTKNNVYLVTNGRVKKTLENTPNINHDCIFYSPDTPIHQFLDKHSTLLPQRLSLITFGLASQMLSKFYQWRLAAKIIKKHNIDLIHEPAPVSPVLPSAMFGLGVPVVIGPMNGGMAFPSAFTHMASFFEHYVYKLIRLFTSFFNIVLPGKMFADILLVANERTKKALPRMRFGSVLQVIENGVFDAKDKPKPLTNKSITNIIFVGRLVDWKAVDIIIEAVSLTKSAVILTIVGDGPERLALEQYAISHAIKNVIFLGSIPHTDVNTHYDAADVFVLPSLRECGGAVVLEAMSRGLPVIATNWGGPADYIVPDTGYLIEPKSRAFMVQEFARIIDLLASQPNLRYAIGVAAIAHIKKNFLWENKVEHMINIYQQAILNKA